MAKKLESMGSDTLAIKDMAGLLTTQSTKELVSLLTKNISIPRMIKNINFNLIIT